MPIISVGRDRLFKALGKTYSKYLIRHSFAFIMICSYDVAMRRKQDFLSQSFDLFIFSAQVKNNLRNSALTSELSWTML